MKHGAGLNVPWVVVGLMVGWLEGALLGAGAALLACGYRSGSWLVAAGIVLGVACVIATATRDLAR